MGLKYLGILLAYLRVVCENVVFGPLIIGSLKVFQRSTEMEIIGIAVIGLVLHLGIVYPISLYCSSDTSILTPNGDRKFSLLNIELFFNIFKLLFVIMTVLSQKSMPYLTSVFFVIFVILVLKKPFYCF